MRNQAQVLLKRSHTLGKLVNTYIKGITLLYTDKINICVSCVFNGFKYINTKIEDAVNSEELNSQIFNVQEGNAT